MTTLFANESEEGAGPKEKPLNDDLYLCLRDLHISDVGKTIAADVKEVREVHKVSSNFLFSSCSRNGSGSLVQVQIWAELFPVPREI